MRSSSPPVERARPLLGTRVAIRVAGLSRAAAHRAIDAAFAEVAGVHARMSFHDPASDVSRLNREARYRPVRVDPRTLEVLRWSQELARRSGGCFDVTVAAQLVRWGRLPRPARHAPDPRGSWRDVELRGDGAVRFHRAVWIDLGGVGKGYAVDRAIERLRGLGVEQACVNAGGDLRVLGPRAEWVRLRPAAGAGRRLAILEIADAGVAGSGQDEECRRPGPHVHGRTRRPTAGSRFAWVIAERCVVADALTKVVLARGRRSAPLLRDLGATAHLYRVGRGWRTFGATC